MSGKPVGEESLRIALGDNADKALERNPFEKRRKWVNTIQDARKNSVNFLELGGIKNAKKYLTEFLESLEGGERWTAEALKRWNAADGTHGHSIYNWLMQNIRCDDKIDWIYILTKIKLEKGSHFWGYVLWHNFFSDVRGGLYV